MKITYALFNATSSLPELEIQKIYIHRTGLIYFYNVDTYYNQVIRIRQSLSKIITIIEMCDALHLRILIFWHTRHSKEPISVSFKAKVLRHISFERPRCKNFWYMQYLCYMPYIILKKKFGSTQFFYPKAKSMSFCSFKWYVFQYCNFETHRDCLFAINCRQNGKKVLQ